MKSYFVENFAFFSVSLMISPPSYTCGVLWCVRLCNFAPHLRGLSFVKKGNIDNNKLLAKDFSTNKISSSLLLLSQKLNLYRPHANLLCCTGIYPTRMYLCVLASPELE